MLYNHEMTREALITHYLDPDNAAGVRGEGVVTHFQNQLRFMMFGAALPHPRLGVPDLPINTERADALIEEARTGHESRSQEVLLKGDHDITEDLTQVVTSRVTSSMRFLDDFYRYILTKLIPDARNTGETVTFLSTSLADFYEWRGVSTTNNALARALSSSGIVGDTVLPGYNVTISGSMKLGNKARILKIAPSYRKSDELSLETCHNCPNYFVDDSSIGRCALVGLSHEKSDETYETVGQNGSAIIDRAIELFSKERRENTKLTYAATFPTGCAIRGVFSHINASRAAGERPSIPSELPRTTEGLVELATILAEQVFLQRPPKL